MSKSNPYLHDEKRIQEVLQTAILLRIAYLDHGNPAIVPVNFGYHDHCLYFHSSQTGNKMECFRQNPLVSFEADCGIEIVKANLPCQATVHYQSVIGSGKVTFIEEESQKIQALLVILKQHGIDEEDMPAASIKNTAVLCIRIESCTYKQSPV